MAKFTAEAAVALVFAILYLFLTVWMFTGYATGRYKAKSRWSLLAFHVAIRVASQACGVAFGILAFDNTDVFVAYLILGAEGYFTLTLASYLFLKSWHQHHLGFSFLAPLNPSKEEGRRIIWETLALVPIFMPWRYWRHHLLAIVHCVLIPANAIIITGGSMLAGSIDPETGESYGDIAKKEKTAKALRTTGSALFFCMTVTFLVSLIITIFEARKRQRQRNEVVRIHPTLLILLVVAFWLHVRGLFGVLQAGVNSLSYLSPSNYTGEGFTHRFTAIEYCLTVLPEFMSAFLLNMTYFTSRNDPSLHKQQKLNDDKLDSVSDNKATRDANDKT